jgi:hypothetical protein
MATANIQLPDGTNVSIEGTPEEISKVLNLYGPKAPATDVVVRTPMGQRPITNSRTTNGAMRYLRELIAENFFSERRSLSDVQQRLETLGHIFPISHLSTPLRRLVVGRQLRRLKDGRNWVYVRG